MPVLEVGVDTYGTVAGSDTYFLDRPHSTKWFEATATEESKENALRFSCIHLDTMYYWLGQPTSKDQTLAFPRDCIYTRQGALIDKTIIPLEIVQAHYELAYQWLGADQLMPPAAHKTGSDQEIIKGQIEELMLGKMKVRYYPKDSYLQNLFDNFSPMKKSYPYITMLLKHLIKGDPNSMFGRVAI